MPAPSRLNGDTDCHEQLTTQLPAGQLQPLRQTAVRLPLGGRVVEAEYCGRRRHAADTSIESQSVLIDVVGRDEYALDAVFSCAPADLLDQAAPDTAPLVLLLYAYVVYEQFGSFAVRHRDRVGGDSADHLARYLGGDRKEVGSRKQVIDVIVAWSDCRLFKDGRKHLKEGPGRVAVSGREPSNSCFHVHTLSECLGPFQKTPECLILYSDPGHELDDLGIRGICVPCVEVACAKVA